MEKDNILDIVNKAKLNIVNELFFQKNEEPADPPGKDEKNFIERIRNFLLYFRKGLLKGNIQGLERLPSNIKQTAKRMTTKKFLYTIDQQDRIVVKKLNDKYFSKMTDNEFFSNLLSYMVYLKAKITKTPIPVQIKKAEVQYRNYTKNEKNAGLGIVFVIVLTLWLLIYYSFQTNNWNPKLNLPQDSNFLRKMFDKIGISNQYTLQIPLVTFLLVMLVAGLYHYNKDVLTGEPSGNAEIETAEEKKIKIRKAKSTKTDKDEPFVL